MTTTADALDYQLALERLRSIARQDLELSQIVCFVHHGEPIPQARARATRFGHHYTDKRTAAAQGEIIRAWREAWRRNPPLLDTLALVAIFYQSTLRQKDGDNLVKLVMDAGTKAQVWKDDSQVKGQTWLVELDRQRPRTVVALGPRLSTFSKVPLFVQSEGVV